MGRLDNIIARNRRPNRVQERVIVSMVFGGVILLILALAVFTDLGLPPDAHDLPADRSEQPAPPPGQATHVDGVLLARPPKR